MHIALARKWRPRVFEDLVGQESVARTLSNAIAEGRVASAYLLTGPRGVGKTSTARMMARALNCEKGPTIHPCGECASCREILERGESLDVHELDGASNRKIENARELIETIRYAPQRDRFRIAVIDEVHMFTIEAFNALLKTLEEPPPYARFILASTELHKIPATIVSRCQRFAFRALTVPEISTQLAKVAKAEKIKTTPGALRLLAGAAEGSLRDGLSLLDQAATISEGQVDEARCAEILALVDQSLLEGLYSSAASGDRAAAITTLSRLTEAGADPRHVLKEFAGLLRRLLLAAAGSPPDAEPEERERLTILSKAMPYENLLRAVSLILSAEELVRKVDDPTLAVQMLILKLAELPRLRDIEGAIAGLPPASGPAAAQSRRDAAAPPRLESAPPARAAAAAPPRVEAVAPSRVEMPRAREEGPRIVSLVPVESERDEPATDAPPPGGDPITRFHDILDSRRRVTAAQVSLAESVFAKGDDLVFRFGIDRAAAKEALEDHAAKRLLTEVAREAYGRPMRVVLKTGPPADGDLGKVARDLPGATISRERASSKAESDPMVRSAMELFHGELTEVKEEE